MKPLVSVIVPTFNRPGLLREAVESVLSQTYRNIEIIVVNDAGDDVEDIINSLNAEIIYLSHEINRGLASARNTALKSASGKYIAYLDDDDVFYPGHIETLVRFLERKAAWVAYTDSNLVVRSLENGELATKHKGIYFGRDFDARSLLVSNYIPVINVMHRRDALQKTGAFDENLLYNEDWDLWIRLSRHYEFHHLREATAEVRMREGVSSSYGDRMPFLVHMEALHKKHEGLADERTAVEQGKAVKALKGELCMERLAAFGRRLAAAHRYLFAREFARGKRALDLHPADGSGGLALSEAAAEAVGLTISERELANARMYKSDNLKFVKCDMRRERFGAEGDFDVIVYFRDAAGAGDLAKAARIARGLLKGDGLFLASARSEAVPAKEMKAALAGSFGQTALFGQGVHPESDIFPLSEPLPAVPSSGKAEYVISISAEALPDEAAVSAYIAGSSSALLRRKDEMLDDLQRLAEGLRQAAYADPCHLEDVIREIQESASWKLATALAGLASKAFPENTARGRLLHALLARIGLANRRS